MEYGAHLPLLSFQGESRKLADLEAFTDAARELGYTFLCANDHLVFSRAWLDGPTALSAVMSRSGGMKLATTICLPVVRGPGPTAKWLAAMDVLSNGRVVAGVGPGSSARDYALVGISYDERWARLEESIHTMRAMFSGSTFDGEYYSTNKEQFEPLPVQKGGPPVWMGSWGSQGGLRRTAALADGWLASGYNTTPAKFGKSLAALNEKLQEAGKDPGNFPNGIATMWTYVTEDRAEAKRMLEEVLSPMLKRSVEELQEKLPIGSPEHCADLLRLYRKAGAQRVFIWPVADEVEQLRRVQEQVAPLVAQD